MSQVDDLWRRYKLYDDNGAREELVLHYAYFAKYVLDRMGLRPTGSLSYEDLLGYAVCGLIDAIERFDITRKIKLETFAAQRIKGAVLDAVKSQDWMPRSVRSSISKLKRTMANLEAQLGRAATDEEIAYAMGISTEDLDELFACINQSSLISLDDLFAYGEESQSGGEFGPTDDGTGDPLRAAESKQRNELLANALTGLPEREKLVLSLYYSEELTFKEIARILDITESRVCQIHAKAIIRLKGKLNRHADIMTAAI